MTTSAAKALLFHCPLSLIQAHPLEAAQSIVGGRLMCLLKAIESSPATLVASQLLLSRQLTPSSMLRQNHKKKEEHVEFIKVYT